MIFNCEFGLFRLMIPTAEFVVAMTIDCVSTDAPLLMFRVPCPCSAMTILFVFVQCVLLSWSVSVPVALVFLPRYVFSVDNVEPLFSRRFAFAL